MSSLPGTIPSSTLPRLSQTAPDVQEHQQDLPSSRKGRRRAHFSEPLPHSATRHTWQHQSSPLPAHASGVGGAPAGPPQHADGTVAGSAAYAAATAAAPSAVHGCGTLSIPSSEPVTEAGAAADRTGLATDTDMSPAVVAGVSTHCVSEGGAASASGAGDQDADRVGWADEDLEEPPSMRPDSGEVSSDGDEGVLGIARAPPWQLDQIPKMHGSLLRWLHPSHDHPGLAQCSGQPPVTGPIVVVQQCWTLWEPCLYTYVQAQHRFIVATCKRHSKKKMISIAQAFRMHKNSAAGGALSGLRPCR